MRHGPILSQLKYKPAVLDSLAILKWLEKSTFPRGRPMTNETYLLSLDILNHEFRPYVRGGVMSIEEVLSEVDMSKSPGLPYVDLGCDTKAKAWELYRDEITDCVNQLLHGKYVQCLFQASLKDELVLEGKAARVFLPSPFHHQLACAILFKRISDSLIACVHKTSSALGIDLFARGLEREFARLSKMPFAYDGDYSKWDLSFSGAEPERDFIKQFVEVEYHEAVDLLFNLALCPEVLVDGSVIQMMINPSGWYLTAVLNTLKNYRYLVQGFIELSVKFNDPVHYTDVQNHLLCLCGGDDFAFSTTKSWFTIAEFGSWVSYNCGPDVTSDYLTPRFAMDLTFFSHTLVLREFKDLKIYVPLGRLDKLIASFSYIKKENGVINWLSSAQRVIGLFVNVWASKSSFDILSPYIGHLIYEYFHLSGGVLTSEWRGVFDAIPNDINMFDRWLGVTREGGFPFFLSPMPFSRKLAIESKAKPNFKYTYQSLELTKRKMNRNNRAQKILDKLTRTTSLSNDGADWLVSAIDPFHDVDLKLAGYPDTQNASTCIQLIKT